MSSNEKTPNFQQQPESKVKHVRAADFKSFYTNFVQAGFSAFDIGFLLAETAGVNEDGQLVIETKARVTMSPLEAKVLLVIVTNIINNYEAQFGKINVPEGALPKLEGDKTEGV